MTHRRLTRPSCTPCARYTLPLALAPLVACPLSCAPELAVPAHLDELDEAEVTETAGETDAAPELQIEPAA
ncbi:MAG TPA: hypothetical protein VL242_39640, partial [Sorangium sp.]|nr:hypothetical protein [Sorangium sp.]